MMARPPKEVLILDMPFSEALERYTGVPLTEVSANVIKGKKRRKPKHNKKRKR